MKFVNTSFVFDVCLGKRTVKLLDFNPFDRVTDSLLYSWEELTQNEMEKLELRVVEEDIGVQSNQYSMYSHPKDALDFNELATNDFDALSSLIEKVSAFD